MHTSDDGIPQVLANCQRTARLGLLLSVAAVLHVIEAQLPSLPLPGARLGLANLASILAIYAWGWREGLLVAVLRQVLGGLFTGALLGPPFWFGLVGAVLSVFVMGSAVVASQGRLPTIPVSILGAVAHNMGQLVVAYMLVRQPAVIAYWPFLLFLALPSGAVVGYLAGVLLPLLREDHWDEGMAVSIGLWGNRLVASIFLVLFVVGAMLPLRQNLLRQNEGAVHRTHVEISVDGRQVARLPLDTDVTYQVPLATGRMRVSVRDGGVAVVESDCPDQICVHTGRIRRPSQAVICVPNRVVVRITGEAEPDVDAVSG